ncbi:MAG TPA: iron-containing alcohol dehydrogenase [Solirubrobacteraceae bacterium]|jgi:alcohol dehydrogenase class IV|nr:iron-containing alcohol dehydrogenase [Solirubrobacteraceae bacterium]
MRDFTWKDGERVVRFGRGAIADARELLGDDYALLTTERAQSAAPDVVAGARSVHHVAPGLVDHLSAALIGEVPDAPVLAALGGGRVIDTAKAIAGGRGGRPRVAAIPTTLSAAEMTRVHRLPEGVDGAVNVRPAVVINDPELCASQPEERLAASAANSLGHAVEAPLTAEASPIPSLAAREAVRLTAAAYSDGTPDRDALALAALLSGYAIDANHYGLHHVLSQMLARVAGVGHGSANAAMLPHTIGALRERGDVPAEADALARELAERAGAVRLRDLGVERETLGHCADATVAFRGDDLARTPPALTRAEVLALYEAAW